MSSCLIFDNDGTLVDSELVQHRAMSDELSELGIELVPAALSAKYRGWKLSDQIADISNESGKLIDPGLVDRFRLRLNRYLRSELEPTPGVAEALKLLPGVKCVASNAPVQKVELCLEVTGLAKFFSDHYFSAYDIESWKPDPGLFLHVAESMGFVPAACIVVEDSVVGVEAGRLAGMRVVAYNPHGLDLPAGRGVIEISDMSDLPRAISRLGDHDYS